MWSPMRIYGATITRRTDTVLFNCNCRRLSSFSSTPAQKLTVRNQPKCHARSFSSASAVWSGHSKWASIKHDKGKNDAAKSKQRSQMTKDITNAVKLGGPNPTMNPRLALAITTAKKSAVPKGSIEAAIARGQGLSASGTALESVTLEAILPPSIATVIECQTDNKLRILADLRLLVKEAGGTVSPIGYMFEKKGRIILQQKEGYGMEEIMDTALEAGVIDMLEDEQDRVVLYTEPADTSTTVEKIKKSLDVEIEESEIIWDPNEDTMVALDDEAAAAQLNDFLDDLQEIAGIQAVYVNWAKGKISENLWAELRSKVAV
ncbi:transcriptional regulator-domain-containing protein [Dendryphion nanum]|uniref:Transcriptional regulator-domain-containing protein n=1 Tax=Dendryphion nanum TaxID=256645 RepID=A0A9P9DTB0_9PLEO|nr:transcriptional regulator-domain-containing protein [Dendryphion nanum]